MKELTTLCIGAGIGIFAILALLANNEPKASEQHPYIYWSDSKNTPPKGFEKVVDIYYTQARDTVFMELSYGPE
jgi:hypothetical protein